MTTLPHSTEFHAMNILLEYQKPLNSILHVIPFSAILKPHNVHLVTYMY